MKNLPLYQNLDTSFVNLPALVRYLRGRRFAGSLRVELADGYEAEIEFAAGGEVRTREHDRLAGRIAEGEEAFQRLIIRARAPGGAIHVFQTIAGAEAAGPEIPTAPPGADRGGDGRGAPVKEELPRPVPEIKVRETGRKINFVDAAPGAGEKDVSPAAAAVPPVPPASAAPPPPPPPPPPVLAPLEFSNRVEEKARQAQITTEQEWQTLLQLAGELLGAIDETLAEAGLDFVSAFAKARGEISADYPFFNPSAGAFEYSEGRVRMGEPVSPKLFSAGLNEALRRILEKLGAGGRFPEVYRRTVQAILALVHRRRQLYDKFFITPGLEKILGV